jgi:hypothetical protein
MREPNFNKPEDIAAFLGNELGLCGCTDEEPYLKALIRLLEWHNNKDVGFESLYFDDGVYYLLAGMIDRAGLSEHGSSIRAPFLSTKGRELLKGLKTITIEELRHTEKEAYDGVYHCLFG